MLARNANLSPALEIQAKVDWLTNCSKLTIFSTEVSGTIGQLKLLEGVVMAQAAQPEFDCSICNKPVDVSTAKTNAVGKAVHEKCYALEQALIRAAQATSAKVHGKALSGSE